MRPRKAIFLAFLLSGSAWAEQIVLKDADRITGAIVKTDGQQLTIESKNSAVVRLNWADVETIASESPLTVVLSGDRAIKGPIVTQGGQIIVNSSGNPQTVPPGDVLVLRNDAEQRAYERLLKPGLLDLWTITG